MSMNPYDAPHTTVEVVSAPPIVPKETTDDIKFGWVAALISGCATLLVTLLAISGTSILGYSAWELIDVALIFGLAYGIYRKSRTCAVLMLVYFIGSKIMLMKVGAPSSGLIISIIFLYYFSRAVRGTFKYHRLLKAHAAAPAT